MHSGDALPTVYQDALIRDALLEVSQKGLGMTAVIDKDMTLLGIFTDGDLRRLLDQRIDVHTTPISQVMTKNPTVATPNLLAVEGFYIMQEKSINGLMLCQDGKLVGALNMHDLLKGWSNVMSQNDTYSIRTSSNDYHEYSQRTSNY